MLLPRAVARDESKVREWTRCVLGVAYARCGAPRVAKQMLLSTFDANRETKVLRRFRDRAEAGQILAERLGHYADRDDVIVLALPRGGVPVAYELEIVPGATHLFEEPGALQRAAQLARGWFLRYLARTPLDTRASSERDRNAATRW